jgi:hypothetical protein
MPPTLRFPLHFDPGKLQMDLARIDPAEWIPHFNKSYYEGDWSAVPLRSIGGSSGQIYPDPAARNYQPTAILERCPYFQEVLARFCCDLLSVRLLRLQAGSRIREHTDLNMGFEDGEIRLHIPVQTNPSVEFYLNRQRIVLDAGECWYVNTSLPHRVVNRSAEDRIHLVMDCVVNEWMASFFPVELAARAGSDGV